MPSRWLLGKFVFALAHIHARPAKRHALHAQTESLFGGAFSTQLDGPARADHAMPRQSRNLLQDAHHLTGGSRPARSPRDRPVTRYHPRRQGANAAHDPRALIFRRAPLSARSRLRIPFHKSAADEQQTLFLPTTKDERPTTVTAHANLDSPIQKFTQARKTWDYDRCISCGCPPPKLPFGEYYASLVESPAADLGPCRPDRLCHLRRQLWFQQFAGSFRKCDLR